MKSITTLIVIILSSVVLRAQDLHYYILPKTDTINHSSVTTHTRLPLILNSKRSLTKWMTDKIFHENLIIVNKNNFFLTADPIFGGVIGRETVSGNRVWENTRAFQIQGKLDLDSKDDMVRQSEGHSRESGNRMAIHRSFKSLSFSTSYFETQFAHPPYLDSIVKTLRATPGQLRARDASYATGWIKYQPNKIFSFEAGHGKNFIGNGYRSLLLSDGATPYPYFRIDTKIWRIHYVNLWAELQDINFRDNFADGYQKKYAAIHYLSLAITNRLEAGLFEVVNWQGRDSTHHRGFDINYLNPIIMFRPVEWTMGSPDNILMGANLSYRFGQNTYLYGQMIMDEFKISEAKNWSAGWWANKMGWQIGAKTWIPLTRVGSQQPPIPNPQSLIPRFVFLQSEFNAVRPYTYSHTTSKQNYGHYNQAMAHPLGGNFKEWVNFVRLRWDRIVVEGQYNYAKFGSDFNGSNFGHNIFLSYNDRISDYDVFIGNGLLNTLSYKIFTVSYLVNSASNFNIFVKLIDRRQVTELKDRHDLIFQVGFRNSIRNLYYDF